ncbi:VWA domain-containing protein, partial [Coprococcus eutactus]|uniref:VWA domain-containing protein n=1 Tax=Coprococcus eutactus TaxID=33043 RepID=UPI00210A94A4|nr:von Willebrand factor type A domain-containing protein [Coprococcus eutactus]
METLAGETAMVTDTSNSMYSEVAYDTREYESMTENGVVSTVDRPLSTIAADRDTASYSNVRSY